MVVLWGLNFVAVKTALATLPPLLLTGLRFASVALILAPFFRPRPEQMKAIAGIAVILGIGHFGLLFVGLSGMEAATTAIVTQLGVPFSALLAWVVFGETLGVGRAIGLVMAFAGIALLAGEPTLPSLAPLGIVTIAMLAWAISNTQVKKVGNIDPMALNGWMAAFAAPMLLVLSLLTEHGQYEAITASGWKVWTGVAYTVLASSIVAYSLWYRLLARHDINRIVPITLLGPVIGVAAGVTLLGESLTWQKLVGGTIVVAGVAAVQFAGRKRIVE